MSKYPHGLIPKTKSKICILYMKPFCSKKRNLAVRHRKRGDYAI